MLSLVVEPIMMQSIEVLSVAQSQPEVVVLNQDNICVVNEYSLLKTTYISIGVKLG